MIPVGVHHVSLVVDDLDRALDFYTRRLGLVRRTDRPGRLDPGAWLDAGGQQIHLVTGAPPAPRGQHIALQVADLDAVVGELRAAGMPVGDPAPIGTGRQAFLTDPAGNAVELHEPTTGSEQS